MWRGPAVGLLGLLAILGKIGGATPHMDLYSKGLLDAAPWDLQ